MNILKNDTSDMVLQIKERAGLTWEDTAKLLEISKQTFYNRMQKGGWKNMEKLWVKTKHQASQF
jgi:DNA-binding XRE family transcriptional regulator